MNTTSPMSDELRIPQLLEHQAREHAEPVEREVAARQRELASGDVPALGQALLAELQRAEHEEIGALVEPLLAHADPIHDAVAESELGHGY